ncbi:major facilitator superfamily domain-containing protein [Nemania serpens]|nr:major facilitator superfamily domain-containing protein [Nemania serpens]
MTNDDDESHNASESSPLLQGTANPAGDVPVHTEIASTISGVVVPPKLKGRIISLLCAYAFAMMLADNLQPAALTKVFEDVICDSYYNHSPQSPSPSPSPPTEGGDPCEAQPVQRELALVRGFLQLMPIFSGLLCTVPYGLLAERIGRKRVLVLSGAGTLAAFSWVLAVCYWRFLSLRWVLLSGAFLFVGGGDPVLSSMLHVMVTDATDQAERAQIFLYLHAADVVAGFFGPAISAPLMEKGHTWAVLLLAVAVLVTSIIALALLVPETLHLKARSANHPDQAKNILSSPETASSWSPQRSIQSAVPKRKGGFGLGGIYNSIASLVSLLTSNRQAMLLLCLFAPQTASRELFTLIGLQYSSAKFALPYARGNVLLSLQQAAQGLVVLVVLPLITRLVANPRGWTAWARDRTYATVSIILSATGLLVIGIAPALAVEVLGLLFIALGSCSSGLLMSLLGAAVRPSQVSVVYSSALMLSIIARSLTGLVESALLVKGLELGWAWMGLPFVAMGLFMVCVGIASVFVTTEKIEHSDEE